MQGIARARATAGGVAVVVLAVLLPPPPAAGQAGRPIGEAEYDSAFFAWEAGAYADALRRLERLLAGPSGERYVSAAAELTGEVWVTHELAADGREVRWSPDSRHVAYEVGSGGARRTYVARVDGVQVARLEGGGAAFDERGGVTYVAGAGAVVVRDLATGAETRVGAPGLNVQGVLFRPGDVRVHVLAPAAAGAMQVYRLGGGGPEQVTRGPGPKTRLRWVTPDLVLYAVDGSTFVIEDVTTGSVRTVTGSGATASPDGSTVAWVATEDGEHVVRAFRAGGAAPRVVLRTADAVLNPSLSADGRLLVLQRMPREDWELYVYDVEAGVERRLTREIQHDVAPRFVSDSTILALLGEPRHRRSYLHDIASGARTRLFHNNTVRTVAPEYEWEVSPDGTKVLIVADRDGDTVSPERGVYVVDLARPVPLADVRARIAAQLRAELELRERGARLFAGIADAARTVVADVSKDRAYRYSYDLYQFGSKYITQPGNHQAIEYLAAQLRQWGYEPELQWFEARPRSASPGAPVVRTANVIARLRGTAHPDVVYVVSSHFDSVEESPGADDNTSGTAALLEVARVLAARPQPATIHFAFLTAEEAGLLGAREYTRTALERGDAVVGFVNNDMIGFANDQRLDNTIRYTNAGIRDVQHAAALLFTDLITYDTRYYRGTDAHALFDAFGDVGGGIGSYPILGNPHYHTSHDVLETINHQLVTEVARATAATMLQLTNVPSRPVLAQAALRDAGTLEVSWRAALESDVVGWDVEVLGAAGGTKRRQHVQTPAATLRGVADGDAVEVRAVNRRGARSWDALRVIVEAAALAERPVDGR
jgi:hypothetical protein